MDVHFYRNLVFGLIRLSILIWLNFWFNFCKYLTFQLLFNQLLFFITFESTK